MRAITLNKKKNEKIKWNKKQREIKMGIARIWVSQIFSGWEMNMIDTKICQGFLRFVLQI